MTASIGKMRRILVGQSLKQIATVFKSEWRMLTKICWLSVLLLCILICLRSYLQVHLHEVGNWKYSYSTIVNVYLLLKAMLSAVFLVGVYRYLLADPRFQIKAFPLRADFNTGNPTLSINAYFAIDGAVIALAVFFACWDILYNYADHFSRAYVSHHLSPSGNFWDALPLMALLFIWRVILFFFESQLCLIFPYIAVSKNITLQGIGKNIEILKGNRVRVWAVQSLIVISLIGIQNLFFASSKFLIHHHILGAQYNNTMLLLTLVMENIAWVSSLLFSAIFFATIFKSFGVWNADLAPAKV